MITEWLAQLGTNIAAWFLTLFPSGWTIPSWMTGFVTTLDGFVNDANGMGVWVPWAIIGVVVAWVLGFWSIGFGIRALRWLIGLLPTMGGGS